ncbi:MAG: NfeD family protein [Phycisphaeraceae bacterium]|nr:NfeD family protein [Phycisphaeraceae bacterium]
MSTLHLLATTAGAIDSDGHLLVWGATLFGVALVLVVLELFIPSGGLISLVAAAAAIGSIAAFFRYDTTVGFGALGVYLVLIPVGMLFFFKVWVHTGIGRRMILGGPDALEEPTLDEAESERRRRFEQVQGLIGAEGIAETSLRPIGVVRIAGRRVDAMAEMGIIDAGTPVTVVSVYDNQIKVRPRA